MRRRVLPPSRRKVVRCGVGVLPLSRRKVVRCGVGFCRFRGAKLCVAAWEILGDFERLWEILGIFLCRFKTASQYQTVLLTVKAAMYSPKSSQYFPILLNTSQAAIYRTARVCGATKAPSTVLPAYAAQPQAAINRTAHVCGATKVPSTVPPAHAAPPKRHLPYCPRMRRTPRRYKK